MRIALTLLVAAALTAPASAAELTVSLKTPSGEPVRDAVISYRPASGGAQVKVGGHYEMVQENIQFHPFVLVVPLGAEVTFPNHDKVRHHVYSFSPAKRFELKLFGHEETRTVRFDKPGIVALGCNIHDKMIAFIDVVDTPYAAKTDDMGRVTLSGLPEGPGQLTVWHPGLRTPQNEQVHPLSLARGGANEAYIIDLRPSAPMVMH
jgi:plastocyanin